MLESVKSISKEEACEIVKELLSSQIISMHDVNTVYSELKRNSEVSINYNDEFLYDENVKTYQLNSLVHLFKLKHNIIKRIFNKNYNAENFEIIGRELKLYERLPIYNGKHNDVLQKIITYLKISNHLVKTKLLRSNHFYNAKNHIINKLITNGF